MLVKGGGGTTCDGQRRRGTGEVMGNLFVKLVMLTLIVVMNCTVCKWGQGVGDRILLELFSTKLFCVLGHCKAEGEAGVFDGK